MACYYCVPVGLVAVGTLTLHRVKYETAWAGDSVGVAIHTEVKLVTDVRIRMGEVAVLSRAALKAKRSDWKGDNCRTYGRRLGWL